MLQQYPGGARSTDKFGRVPLHYALAHGASLKVIESLLNVYPEACRVRDVKGWLPLHVICQRADSVAKVKVVHRAYPEAVFGRTYMGSTPKQMVWAANSPYSNSIVSLLDAETNWLIKTEHQEEVSARLMTLGFQPHGKKARP